ncbi:MAG: BatD family protein [Candidatus Omnitrophica bacterium]|nr:BatD family protein [Candidatus Omnitrophota bacterium]
MNHYFRKKIFLSLYSLALLFLASEGGEFSLTSEINKKRVKMGEEFTLTISLTGDYRVRPELKIPDLSEFVVLSSQQSSTFNLRGKKHQTNIKYEFRLLPKKPGVFSIGPVELNYKNQLYKTKILTIEVLPSETPSPGKKSPWKIRKGVIL